MRIPYDNFRECYHIAGIRIPTAIGYYLTCTLAIIEYRKPLNGATWGKTLKMIARRECRPHWLRG